MSAQIGEAGDEEQRQGVDHPVNLPEPAAQHLDQCECAEAEREAVGDRERQRDA